MSEFDGLIDEWKICECGGNNIFLIIEVKNLCHTHQIKKIVLHAYVDYWVDLHGGHNDYQLYIKILMLSTRTRCTIQLNNLLIDKELSNTQ